MRFSVANGALRDAAQRVGTLEADVNRAVLEAAGRLDGAEVAPAAEPLANAVAGALGDLADALLGLRQGLEAAAEAYGAPEAQTSAACTSRPTLTVGAAFSSPAAPRSGSCPAATPATTGGAGARRPSTP